MSHTNHKHNNRSARPGHRGLANSHPSHPPIRGIRRTVFRNRFGLPLKDYPQRLGTCADATCAHSYHSRCNFSHETTYSPYDDAA